MPAVITTSDGRRVQLDARTSVMADMLAELAGSVKSLEYGSVEFHCQGKRIAAKVISSHPPRQIERTV